jgi:pentose-5-phosphate-3-epimerase
MMPLLYSHLPINFLHGAVRQPPLVVNPHPDGCPMLIIIKDQTKRIEFSIEVEKYLTRNGHEVVRVKSNDSKADIHFKLRTPITDTNEYEKLITKVIKMAYQKGYEIE